MDDPRAKMEGNGLLGLGAPRVDWSRTPGRMPGIWLSVAGIVLAVPVPTAGFILAIIALMLSVKVLGVMPAGARGRRLTMASATLAIAAILLALVRIFA